MFVRGAAIPSLEMVRCSAHLLQWDGTGGIQFMNLRSLDLNLLVVFDAIYKEKNITRAARKVGLSQSSVSSALNRLRGHLNDDLFLRGNDGMRPTARATELADPIGSMLVSLQDVLDPITFDPANEKRTFTVATSDYFEAFVAPKLALHLSTFAPGIDVRLVAGLTHAHQMLDHGEADFAVGVFNSAPERFESVHLLQDSFISMVNTKHPLASGNPTLEGYLAARHLLISPSGDGVGIVDAELAKLGLKRRVAMTVSTLAVAPAIVHESDLVLTAPARVIKHYANPDNFLFPCPVEIPNSSCKLNLIWHKRLSVHPSQLWFRDLLIQIASGLP